MTDWSTNWIELNKCKYEELTGNNFTPVSCTDYNKHVMWDSIISYVYLQQVKKLFDDIYSIL